MGKFVKTYWNCSCKLPNWGEVFDRRIAPGSVYECDCGQNWELTDGHSETYPNGSPRLWKLRK